MGFPYGKEFVYDEMVLTGPGEQGEANAKRVMAANAEKGGPGAPKPGEGPSKEERESGMYDLLFVGLAPDGRQVRVAVRGDRDPGYGSTSKMIAECAICLGAIAGSEGRYLDAVAAMGKPLIDRLVDRAGITLEVETQFSCSRLVASCCGEHAPHHAEHQPEMPPVIGVDDEALADGSQKCREDRKIGPLPGNPNENVAKARR